MADEVTLGELHRRLARLETQLETGQRARDDRLANLASQMVPTALWQAEHKSLQDDLTEHVRQAGIDRDRVERAIADAAKRHERDLKALRDDTDKQIAGLRHELAQKAAKRTEWSRQVKIAVFGMGGAVLAALLGAWVTALLTAKGIR